MSKISLKTDLTNKFSLIRLNAELAVKSLSLNIPVENTKEFLKIINKTSVKLGSLLRLKPSKKLLKCPFCGGTAYSGTEGQGWGDSFVSCRKCKVTMKGKAPCASKDDKELTAEEKWNLRAQE